MATHTAKMKHQHFLENVECQHHRSVFLIFLMLMLELLMIALSKLLSIPKLEQINLMIIYQYSHFQIEHILYYLFWKRTEHN